MKFEWKHENFHPWKCCLLNDSHFSVSLRVLAVPIYCIFPSSSPHSTGALWPLGGLCMLFIFHAVITSTNLARHKECHTSQASSILHRLLVCMHGWGSGKLGYLWYAGDNTVYTSGPMVISVWRCCLPSIGIPIIMTDLSFYNGNQYTWKDQDSPVVGVYLPFPHIAPISWVKLCEKNNN